MAINVYEYGRGRKCVCMFRYTYATIKLRNMQIEKGNRHRKYLCIRQGHRDKGIHWIHRKRRKKIERWLRSQNWTQSTKEQKTHTHDTNSCKRANRKERCVGETKTITHGLKMSFLWSFVTCHDYCVTISRRRSQYYGVSHLSSRRSDCRLTMHVSCFSRRT